MLLKRKFIWLMILMVWVGMVTSIIVYQGSDALPIRPAATEQVQISEGDSENINSQHPEKENDREFFLDYRLERDKARSEQISIFREMINNPNTDTATKKEAQQKMLELTDKVEKEMEIESLIRARGFPDSLAYLHQGSVDIIVPTAGLTKEEVAQIGDIVVKTTGFSFEDVTIIEKKKDN